MMRFLTRFFYVVVFSFIVAAGYQMHRAEAWDDIKGITGAKSSKPLADILEQSLLRKDTKIQFSEAEVNSYLSHHLTAHTHPKMEALYQLDRVAIDFQDHQARVCLRYKVLGKWESTSSLTLQLSRQQNEFIITPTEGKLGRLWVPKGVAALVTGNLNSLVESLQPELSALFQMQNLAFQKDALVMHPIQEKSFDKAR